MKHLFLCINYLDRAPHISSDFPSPHCHLACDSYDFLQASGASRSHGGPLSAPWVTKTVSQVSRQRSPEGLRPQSSALLSSWSFPESLYDRDQRSKILWALWELFLPNPSALSSAHPLPQNSKQLIAPKLFLQRLHSRKTEARNISKAWPQLSAGALLKGFAQKISLFL